MSSQIRPSLDIFVKDPNMFTIHFPQSCVPILWTRSMHQTTTVPLWLHTRARMHACTHTPHCSCACSGEFLSFPHLFGSILSPPVTSPKAPACWQCVSLGLTSSSQPWKQPGLGECTNLGGTQALALLKAPQEMRWSLGWPPHDSVSPLLPAGTTSLSSFSPVSHLICWTC